MYKLRTVVFSVTVVLLGSLPGIRKLGASGLTPATTVTQNRSSASCSDKNKPVITVPNDQGSVVLTDIVKGTTPCPGMKHYVIVTPPNGTDWVQRTPVTIDASGNFITKAQFGE